MNAAEGALGGLRRGAEALLFAFALTGCFGNNATPFPDGLEPWEEPNAAVRAPATASDPCPETLTFANRRWIDPASGRNVLSVHARACIQAPVATVFQAARDPQTGRDPTTTQAFRVVGYDTETAYRWSYQTHVTANTTFAVTPEFDLMWRHDVVEGTEQQPLVTATRWQKTFGSELLEVIEGSLVLGQAVEGADFTEVQYQYHLAAPTSNHQTVQDYLTVIFGRLRDRAHGVALSPDDCEGCPSAPSGY
jgi:hypothetical protein